METLREPLACLAQLWQLLERVALLMRHEDVAVTVTDYDINNAYQYIIAREETHLSWLQQALLSLGAPLPVDPARGAALTAKGDGWKSLAADDAAAVNLAQSGGGER